MIGDIGLMIAAYIVFRVCSEFVSWSDKPGYIGRVFVALVGLGAIVVAGMGVYDILSSSLQIGEAMDALDALPKL